MRCILCGNDSSNVITKKIRSGEERNVFYCENCDLGILDDRRSEQELKDFYAECYRKEHTPTINTESNPQELFDLYSKFQDSRLSLIKDKLGPDKSLLEIGCSAGMFLYNVKPYVGEVNGIDYDVNSVQFAGEKCSCNVFNVAIENTDLPEKSFDIICMFQMLEHVKDPVDFLRSVSKYLKDDGVLYIEVPNLRDALIYAYDLPHHYQFYFHASHLFYYSEKSLKKLLGMIGFEGEVFYTQDYNFLNHMHWMMLDAPQGSCDAGLSSPALKLRNSLEPGKSDALNAFIKDVDKQYKELLADIGLTSNISFIGAKRK
ncbi:class I SAM-dependent methyltransferase [Methanolobus sp. WCC1]|uniref:class I SAM-dependent methyltransferase n=1 Tax=unclassified Methanolobus TaxID=2629569 RepID=UPI0032465BF5